MREPLVEAGLIVGAVGVGIATLRFLLLAVVVVWSLRADNAGRAHARAIVRLLRPARQTTHGAKNEASLARDGRPLRQRQVRQDG